MASTTISTANSCSIVSTFGGYDSSVDGNALAITIIPTANSCCIASAFCRYGSAIDGNTTAGTPISTAYACCLVSAGGCQMAHRTFIFRLGVDGQAAARFHLDTAARGQAALFLQDQVDFSGDHDAGGEGNFSLDNIPACSPVGAYIVSVNQGTGFVGYSVTAHKLLCVLIP